jgi:hypothetical protein
MRKTVSKSLTGFTFPSWRVGTFGKRTRTLRSKSVSRISLSEQAQGEASIRFRKVKVSSSDQRTEEIRQCQKIMAESPINNTRPLCVINQLSKSAMIQSRKMTRVRAETGTHLVGGAAEHVSSQYKDRQKGPAGEGGHDHFGKGGGQQGDKARSQHDHVEDDSNNNLHKLSRPV